MNKFNTEELITKIEMGLTSILNKEQLDLVKYNIIKNLVGVTLKQECTDISTSLDDNDEKMKIFAATKKIEGCTDGTIKQYLLSVNALFAAVNKNYNNIETNDIRAFLWNCQVVKKLKTTTLNNNRRNLNVFFRFLEQEDYIIKNPVNKIKRIKDEVKVKKSLSEEEIIRLKDACENMRDRAIVDFLYSTGARVSEMTKLNITDIDFADRSCVVFGKGSKERIIYFNSDTNIHLQHYIRTREDSSSALFVWEKAPHKRLSNCGVRELLKKTGIAAGIGHVHPHMLRRTFATHSLNRGMNLEHVQMALGHANPQTTLIYAQINQVSLKNSHKICMP